MAKRKTITPPLDLADCVPLAEAAKLANVSERHMRLLVDTGKVAGVQIGRNWLVSRSSAKAFQRHPSMGRPRSDQPEK